MQIAHTQKNAVFRLTRTIFETGRNSKNNFSQKMKSVFQVKHLTLWFTKENIWSCWFKMVYFLNIATFFLLSLCKDRSLVTLNPLFFIFLESHNLKHSPSTYQKCFHHFFSCIIQSCCSHSFEFWWPLQLSNSNVAQKSWEGRKVTVPWRLGRGLRLGSHIPCLPSTAWNQAEPFTHLEEQVLYM